MLIMKKKINLLLVEDAIRQFFSKENCLEKAVNRFDTPEYQNWIQNVANTEIHGKKLLEDSNGENVCYTCFFTERVKNPEFVMVSYFCLHRSIVYDCHTIYNKITLNYVKDGIRIRLPDFIVVSPQQVFDSQFSLLNEFIDKYYPTSIHIPFSFLEEKVDVGQIKLPREMANNYEMLFGAEGNVLKYCISGIKWFSY